MMAHTNIGASCAVNKLAEIDLNSLLADCLFEAALYLAETGLSPEAALDFLLERHAIQSEDAP